MVVIQKTPLPPPVRNAAELTRPVLTEEQQGKETFVLQHFLPDEYMLPGVPEDKGSMTEEEKFWLTKECILRYLRATKWDQKAAVVRLEDTLRWRREFGIYDQMTPEYVEHEGATGKLIIMGYDVDGRPAMYMLPSRQNTDGQKKQLQFSVWMQERAIDLMAVGVETVTVMLDFADKAKQPSFSTSRLWLSYLQAHYPERLGRIQIINMPFLASLAVKAIMPFVDPVTRAKTSINPSVVADGHFAADQVTMAWGGEVEMDPYEHEVYFLALVRMCEERRRGHLERWRRLGGTVGISEWDIRADDFCGREGG